ncbi:LTA synthase family protein [Clostridium sp. P21]|uniref:LTA synthase family protein n=1 Tax=Clostridium muellerianum TaxID=2716538 RepID=A0A7Y0ELZ6_9CLOT|nr:LTA synthase family protein [Clostridium muellerianum]
MNNIRLKINDIKLKINDKFNINIDDLILHVKNNIDIILFLIIIYVKVMHYGKQISPEYFYSKVNRPIIASILILVSFFTLFKQRRRIKLLFILNIVISLVLISDIVYFRYYKDVITVSALKNVKLLTGVSSSVKSLISIKDFLYLIDIVFLIPIIKRFEVVDNKKKVFFRKAAMFVATLLIGVVMDTQSVYAVSKEQPTLISSMSDRIYLTKMIGNINFHVIDAYNYVSTSIKNSSKLSTARENEIKDFLVKNNQSTGTNLTGVGEGKNLIMIQVEALQSFVINQKINGQEITPNLNRWINKSMYFDNYFYQVAGGNTSDAEFMSNNSLYPAESGSAYYSYSGNAYNSLANELKSKQYYTAAFHGNNEGFWNRNVMYPVQGFDKFYGQHSFNIDENVGLGLSDKSFLNQSFDKLKTLKQPYYSFLVTLSSHYPYDDTKGYGNFNVGQYENTLLGNYLKGIHYTDEQLGVFLDKLEKEKITDNSIVVLYGDHFAIPKDNADELYKFEKISNANDLTWEQYQKVPMLIHFPGDENKGVNHTYSAQMDLYPTLANIFNLPRQYMLGKDILNSDSGKVIFRTGTFTDGKVFYISWTNTYYDIKTGAQIPETDTLKAQKEQYLKELQYSDDILNHNLIKDFKKK